MAQTPQIVLIILYLGSIETAAFLNQAEENITTALMKNLEIRHWILAQNTVSDLAKIKNQAKWNVPFLCLSLEKLPNYFLNESLPDINTLIVLKVPNIEMVSNPLRILLTTFTNRYYFAKFKWILFVNHTLLMSEKHELRIPLDCLFLNAQREDNDTYSLKEIYTVKNETFIIEYGTWSYEIGLITSKLSILERRFNLNNTEVVIAPLVPRCMTSRQCAHLQVFKDFSKSMNFRLVWLKNTQNNKNAFVNTCDIYSLATSYVSNNLYNLDYVGPFFKILVNWYIKKPDFREQSNYYVQPFHYKLWISIFATLLLGTIFGMILYYGNKCQTKQLKISDLIFMAFENICNQDGSSGKSSISQRIACFAFRFFALFIIPAYSGVIVSFLAVRKPSIPFQNLQEFVEDGKYVIGVRNIAYPQFYFENSDNPFIRHIYKNYFVTLKDSEILEKFCNEKLALAVLDNDIYNEQLECSFYRLRVPITYADSATLMTRKHGPYTKIFNYAFLKYSSSGVQKKMQERLKGDRRITSENKSLGDVTIYQIIQVLSIVPIGIILASTILLCEISFYYSAKFKNTKQTFF